MSDSETTWRETSIVWLLRIAGAVMLLAFFTMVMPTSWMQYVHRWLGLGELPLHAITEYLTRSLSALYGFHGGLMIVLSTDVRRFRRVVFYVSWMGAVIGACLFGIDVYAGMPTYWIVGEGPPVIGLSVVFLWLLRGVPD